MAAVARACRISRARLNSFGLARQIVRAEGQTLLALADRTGRGVLPGGGAPAVGPRQRDRQRHGQGGPHRPKDRGDAGFDRHAEPFSASRRGDSRRPRPRACRRRGARAFVQRADRRGRAQSCRRCAQLGVPIVAITGQPDSPLGEAAAVTLDLGPIREACPLGLAPTASTAAMLALGDALALVLSRLRAVHGQSILPAFIRAGTWAGSWHASKR